MPGAFHKNEIILEAWDQIQDQLADMRADHPNEAFAVRSSAIAEDSAFASFAGGFETVLDVRTDDAVRAAIHQVHHSRSSERVKAYSEAKGIDGLQDIAVVVQRLVRADISGILFTADPVTGNHSVMIGNYVFGFGEELVSGEVEPYTFTFQRPRGKYEGPQDLLRFARKLFKLASKLEEELGCPQDIEWAIADGKLFILQSRPITTLLGYDQIRGEWNASRTGDYAWASSEVFPDAMTPASWSIWKDFQNMGQIQGITPFGNICGRLYINMSLASAMLKLMGKNETYLVDYVKLTIGFDLSKIVVPEIPATKWQLIKNIFPLMVTMLPKQIRLMKIHDQILKENPSWCKTTRDEIGRTVDRHRLARMWEEELWPAYWNLLQLQDKSNEDYFYPYMSARDKLIKLIGPEETDNLLSNLVGESGSLASMEQLLGLQKLAQGQISREDYSLIAGHRPLSENEISRARLSEDPDWIDQRLRDYAENPIDYRQLAERNKEKYHQIWGAFSDRYPKESGKINKILDKSLKAMETRERIRSELTRFLSVFRAWYLQAGELMGLGDDIFFLQNEEARSLLQNGLSNWEELVYSRKAAYQRHIDMAALPMMISGRFDPYSWVKDPLRRTDYYDAHVVMVEMKKTDLIKGYPGSAGQAEGLVRIIKSPTDSDLLQLGEILVASSTNVGWTPIFPRAAAVVTDVGAPLSHAAIVARELGIPAVIGTGNSTTSLRNGDRVRVDGSHGIVEILEKAPLN
jgi:pyruvate,water dikinase